MKHPLFMLMSFAILSTILPAQTSQKHFVRSSGSASVFVTPDQVQIDFSISTQGQTAQEASSKNATQVAALLAALTKLLGLMRFILLGSVVLALLLIGAVSPAKCYPTTALAVVNQAILFDAYPAAAGYADGGLRGGGGAEKLGANARRVVSGEW